MSTDYKLMREGFILAAKSLVDYFEKMDDREYSLYAKLKFKEVLEKKRKIISSKQRLLNITRRFIRRFNAKWK
jgi:hypothetical protein